MKINWTVRLKNKTFLTSLLALVIAFVYDLLALLGIVPSVDENTMLAAGNAVLTLLGMLGIIIDPTTAGMSDSKRALAYSEPAE
ncbi:MAG: phage holin [Oscillospiraceae bacterium]|nr:phage holin [Oscillospiraceae bacterium]